MTKSAIFSKDRQYTLPSEDAWQDACDLGLVYATRKGYRLVRGFEIAPIKEKDPTGEAGP